MGFYTTNAIFLTHTKPPKNPKNITKSLPNSNFIKKTLENQQTFLCAFETQQKTRTSTKNLQTPQKLLQLYALTKRLNKFHRFIE